MSRFGMPDLDQPVADLDERIRELSDQAERCRAVATAAKAIMLAGIALLLVLAFHLIAMPAAAWLVATAALIGGPVLYGSNRSTLQAICASLAELEARRIEDVKTVNNENARCIGPVELPQGPLL
jgi:hypothetical protein